MPIDRLPNWFLRLLAYLVAVILIWAIFGFWVPAVD